MHVLKHLIASVRVNIPQWFACKRQKVFTTISNAWNCFRWFFFFISFSFACCLNIKINIFANFPTVAWFTFDPELSDASGSGLTFSNDLSTVSVDGWDHRVALGSVGFSRGIHYWEFTVNKYTADTDPTFGIARIDVARDQMLGELVKQ